MSRIGPRIAGQSNAALIDSCLNGDQDAWAELVHRYSRLVFSIALKSGLDEDNAADVVQDVFTIFLRRLESLQDAEHFTAWLITTSRRESWRHKKGMQEQPLDETFEPVDDEPTAAQQVIAWERASLVYRALERLGDRCQRLLRMLFLDDPRPSYEDISASLGIAVGSIGPTRSRCLAQLRDQIGNVGLEYP